MRRSKDPGQIRRLLALAEIYEGRSRGEAARVGGVGLQTLRDWVLRFNATGPAGLADGKAPGQPSRLNDEQRQQLLRMVETGPTPAIHGVVRWRLIDLAQWLFEEYGLSIAKQTLIPSLSDQYPWAQSRRPMEVIFHGWLTRVFQAKQQWSTMSA
jgi:transposase